ncbi:DUF2357 domain-containing protein [Camelliibacillus cellulosilyticus]|uniref:DUF2357 domain-containing protein n=1 Tax=Camelliibacillus cellulosilyticus TaxID=2174486 RepID=A0ABV9GGS9_9BACL
MATPFRVTFKQGGKIVSVSDFYVSESERKPPETVLVENVPLTVMFEAGDPNARFYMDGLDAMPARELKEDEETGDVYLSPSHIPVTLYENTTDYYPFIPGHYQIVVTTGAARYYAWIAIRPKQVDRMTWELMRDEIEDTLEGLAQDATRRTASTAVSETGVAKQASLITRYYRSALAAIHDIYRGPRGHIQKNYRVVAVGRSAPVDEVTIRGRLRHPEDTRHVMVPQSVVNVDLPENRLIKRFTRQLIRQLTTFDQAAAAFKVESEEAHDHGGDEAVNNREKRLPSVDASIRQAEKIKEALERLHQAPWMASVDEGTVPGIPPVMISDARYRLFYKLYREMNQTAKNLESFYDRQWKRTDKMYEIWGTIKLLKTLGASQLGFKPTGGWLYDEGAQHADLPTATRIYFEKDDLRLQVVYDEKLPKISEHTDSRKTPLYITQSHNRPDVRLDVFKQEVYIGSLLIDFKYRPSVYLWQPDKIDAGLRPKAMAQLIDYGNACRTRYLFGAEAHPFVRDMNPVLEVWALYPDQSQTGTTAYCEDYRLRLMALTPGKPDEHLAFALEKYIGQLLKRYDFFIQPNSFGF